MHVPIPAGSRRRTRRALIAAALPAALAALVLPTAADAGTAEVIRASANGVLGYAAADGEVNNVRVSVSGNKLVISDSAPITARNGCTLNLVGDAECPIGVDSISMVLRDGNDVAQYAAPHPGGVVGEDGNDTFLGGVRQAIPGRPIQPVSFLGRAGTDTVSYRLANRGVRVDTDDAQQGDGRPGDQEFVNTDVERIEGSEFGDVLFGSDANNTIIGLNGNDEIGGGRGNDVILENVGPNGADSINGGDGVDRVVYTGRATGVSVTLDGLRNDGQPGEGDDVRPNVENVTGSPNGADLLVGNSLANDLQGFGGVDTLIGAGGNDTLAGGSGRDRLVGDGGNDIIRARDGERDTIDCGIERDTVERDTVEGLTVGCERVTVGKLRLTPKSTRAVAGETVRLRLSWRHPKAWKQLRTIELRLMDDGVPVGAIAIRARGKKITGDGAVASVARGTRIATEGKTVTARLAVRLNNSVAGATLKAEVEATDKRGRRQLERNAATIRIAK